MRVPERLRWVVGLLDVRPGDRILELGCGNGVAVSLICDQLGTGMITAVDRSPAAVERAARRNAPYVAEGRARLSCLDIADVGRLGRGYDKVFAVNVNLFWTRGARAEIGALKEVMRPGGTLHLVYETPPGTPVGHRADTVAAALAAEGFTTTTLVSSPELISIAAALPSA
jgi:cyclopropane fatty-acyl-phospholipid synthase-like methyltransferase